MRRFFTLILATTLTAFAAHSQNTTYAEMLGWNKGDRLLILHIDDAGMSLDSNRGVMKAMTEGVANSVSVMMPCPWVPQIVEWIKENPTVDAGLHLTLTSEWSVYRWGPLAGKPAVPGLTDPIGCLWESVPLVVKTATPDEVELEVRAQVERARTMGFEPTHLDSHMGTLFATDEFMKRYIKVGVEYQIPIMFPGGHNHYALQEYGEERAGAQARQVGQTIWAAGLPVLDDLHNTSYGWKTTDKTDQYIEAIQGLRPGVTMMIMHCTEPTEIFSDISSSGKTRLGDLNAMIDPRFKKAIEDERIILTTWRELKQRRDKVGK